MPTDTYHADYRPHMIHDTPGPQVLSAAVCTLRWSVCIICCARAFNCLAAQKVRRTLAFTESDASDTSLTNVHVAVGLLQTWAKCVCHAESAVVRHMHRSAQSCCLTQRPCFFPSENFETLVVLQGKKVLTLKNGLTRNADDDRVENNNKTARLVQKRKRLIPPGFTSILKQVEAQNRRHFVRNTEE